MSSKEHDASSEALADTEGPESQGPVSSLGGMSATSPDADRGEPPRREPMAGTTKIGRYTILDVLGEGGMGTVYAVYDGQLDRKVALKLVKGIASDSARSRMMREAQAMAKLSHPNVVPVFEVGEHDGELFIAMEFVQGQTLREWRDEVPRTWLQILTKYIAAGEGLAAAHAQDLVHRDFKPDNAVVGEDGRVRVLDFGLAAKTSEALTADTDGVLPTNPEGGLNVSLTETGAVLGTPAYMAAEQFMGEAVDHRTDQFAFCVALWEALYGGRPFQGKGRIELFNAVSNGELTEPGSSGVPSAIRGLLERGLKADPESRWPDLPTLLRQLKRRNVDPAQRRRVVAGGAGVLVLGAGSVWGYGAYQDRQRAAQVAACEEAGAEEIAAVWNDGVRAAAREGLLASGVSYAETTADKALPWLDAYAETWQEARTEACLATRVEQRWTADDLDRSVWCLEQRSMALGSLAEQMAKADEKVVQKTVTAAAGLAQVDPCGDPALLQRLPAPPPTEQREAYRAVRGELSRVGTLLTTAKYEEGLDVARTALTHAESLGDKGLEAAARRLVGALMKRTGMYAEAEQELEAAYFLAAEAHAFETARDAASQLTDLVGYTLKRHDEGQRWGRLAELAFGELGRAQDDVAVAGLLIGPASVHYATGDYAEAKALNERALAIREKALGPDHPGVAASLNNLAGVVYATGGQAEAKTMFERALAIREKALGPDHPDVAASLNNLANVHNATGAYAEAKTMFERALAIKGKALGPDHPDVAVSLNNLAGVLHATGDYAEAKTVLERALAITEKALGPDHPGVAASLNNLANVHDETGDYAEAKTLHERALAIKEKALGPDHPDVAASLNNLGNVHFATGDYAEARTLHERGLAIKEKALGPDHRDVAVSLTGLANVHYASGDYAQAKALNKRALAIVEKALGPDHPDVALSLIGLANVHYATGDYAEAKTLNERALSTVEKALGPDHPDVAASLNSLAAHVSSGEPTEARALYARAVGIFDAHDGLQGGELDARFGYAKALVATGGDRSLAVAEARKAAAGYREAGEPKAKELAEVETWLAKHGD